MEPLDNPVNKTTKPKAKIQTTEVNQASITTHKLTTLSQETSKTITTKTTDTGLSNSTTKIALTIKALNQKTEIKNGFIKSHYKMNSSVRLNEDFNTTQSILVSLNGRAKLCSKQLSDTLKAENLKTKLEEIYSEIENFDRIEIVKIENIR